MSQLLVHEQGQDALIRIIGRGSFRNSVALRDYGKELSARLGSESKILVDMKDCEGMDSTFMGMLASWTHELTKAGKPGPIMVDVSTKVAECMTTLGLSQVVAWTPEGQSPEPYRDTLNACETWDELECHDESELETAHRMFAAHEKLCEIEDTNSGRFKDVLSYLGEKLGKKQNSEDS